MQGEFHMRKKKSYRGTVLIIGISILTFITTIKYIPKKPAENKALPPVEEAVAVKSPKDIILGENSAIKIKTVYSCGHIETKTDNIPNDIIGKTKEEIKLINPNWKIDEFSENLISLEEEIDLPCENHYIIKLKDNTLFVYRKNNENEFLKKQNISTSMLTNDEIEELELGINAESEYEVLEILESFAS